MQRVIRVVRVIALALTAAATRADVKLPAVIGDNMVLQQNAPVTIWGWADVGEKVTVTIGEQKVSATTGEDGKWKLQLEPLTADGPVEMTVAGKNSITAVKNILIGEVWICSGQSNMAWTVRQCKSADEEIKTANLPKIRLFTVPRKSAETPRDNVAARWNVCTPNTVRRFSGVGFFFGRAIHKKLGVPVGLINTSYGGTAAELWTSEQGLAAEPSLKELLDAYTKRGDRQAASDARYKTALAKWETAAAAAKAAGKKPPRKPRHYKYSRFPTGLYNAMIAPLIQFRVAGAIWYQGEANAGRAAQYDTLFPAMIKDWRAKWGYEIPFLFAQLANFRDHKPELAPSKWARLREAQLKTLALPKTGMAVIIDIGEARSIHPINKQDVGSRLALAARAIVYGEKTIVYSGPIYRSMKADGGKITLTFDHVGGGLIIGPPEGAITAGPEEAPKPGAEKLVGFAIAGPDQKFVWASAKIVGNTIVVSSDQVKAPVAVRYGWARNPTCNLYNKEGLPASPFRTNDWEK